jgi:hypothetical protein
MTRKLFIGFFVLLLCSGNAGLSQLGRFAVNLSATWDNRYSSSFSKNWPLTDAEEKADGQSGSGESMSESLEDDDYVSFKWSSVCLSGNCESLGHEAEDLFKSIDRETSVPPPRA